MGFTQPHLPAVDPDAFLQKPLMERMRMLAVEWVENGFGAPRMVHTIYIVKLVVFFAIGGITVATATSGLPAFWHVANGGTSRSSTKRSSCGRCCWRPLASPDPGVLWPARSSR